MKTLGRRGMLDKGIVTLLIALLMYGVGVLAGSPSQRASAEPSSYVTALPFISNGGYGGWTTSISIRNDSGSSQSITIEFNQEIGWELKAANGGGTRIVTAIYPYATLRYWQGDGHVPAGWAGSVTVLSERPVTVLVHEVAPDGQKSSYAVQAHPVY